MNSRRLFELIGESDEQTLAHCEQEAKGKISRFRTKRIIVVAAAVMVALGLITSAFATNSGNQIVDWILNACLKQADYMTSEQVQSAIDAGEWVYLNDNNVAVIVPESPVKILLSNDGGKTWRESVVTGSESMVVFGNPTDHVQYLGGFIGFYGESGGYLILTADVFLGSQAMRLYQTSDGGKTWTEIGNPSDQHSCVITGAGFSTEKIGFISYRYTVDAGPDIWWTSDGGETWDNLSVTLPTEYMKENYRFTPLSPTFEGNQGVYPISVLDFNTEQSSMIYMHSDDYGLTWTFE